MSASISDGSIVLNTKIDESGVIKGTNSIKTAFDKVNAYLGKVGTQIGTNFKKAGNSIKTVFQNLGTFLKGFAGQILGLLSLRAFMNFSREAGEMATQQQANVQRLIDIYGVASQSVGDYIDANARALGMSKSAAASFSAVYGNLFSVWADQKTNAELTAQYLNMTAVVASKSGRTVEDVQERVRSGLLGNTEAIEDLGIFVNVKTIEMTDAFKRMADGRSWEQLGAYEQQQVRTMAILEQATQKYGDEVAETSALTRAQYKAAYEDMQATWGQFVNVVLMPVLKIATQIFNVITAGLRAIAGITGKTIESTDGISQSISGAVDNQETLTDATKDTAKAQKSLSAGFDELNIISKDTANSASSDNSATGGGIGDLGLTGSGTGTDQEEGISTMLATIMGIVGGAMIALGVLLLFNRQIGLGIGFVIAGAATLGVSAVAIGDSNLGIEEKFSSIIAIVGSFVLALGLILLLKVPTAKPLALGMIIAGAGILAVAVAQIAADKIGGEVVNMLHGIITIISSFLLAIGLIMLFSGNISPLSIGLVTTGAVGLVTELTLNKDKVKKALQGWIGGILAVIAGALLVIGLIMLFSGNISPLSIGLVTTGAVGLVTELALNWNYVTEQVTSFFQKNASLIVGISVALIVLGIILLFTGVGIPLAIGLIIAGGGALAATVALNYNFIIDKLKEVWGKAKNFWNTYIAPIFTAEWWANLGKKAINGLLGVIEKGLNWLIDKINIFIGGLSEVVEFAGDLFGANWSIPKIPNVKIPHLAQGAVIPANSEFLAILGDQKHGTNIETPLDTMIQAFKTALSEEGYGREISVSFTVDLDGDTLYKGVKKAENRRAGVGVSNPAFAR